MKVMSLDDLSPDEKRFLLKYRSLSPQDRENADKIFSVFRDFIDDHANYPVNNSTGRAADIVPIKRQPKDDQ